MTDVLELLSPPKAAVPVLTIADVMVHPALDNQRQSIFVSALHEACSALNTRPEWLVANFRDLKRKLAKVKPASVGVLPARWTEIQCQVFEAFDLAGIRSLPGRYREPLSPPWETARRRLRNDLEKARTKHFMSYCTAANIAPSDVTPETFDKFDAEIANNSSVKRAAATSHDTRVTWNNAAKSIPGWPKLEVEVPKRRRDFAYSPDTFPAPFRRDADDYLDKKSNPDIFSDDYHRPLSAITLKQRRQSIYLIATALVESGYPIEQVISLSVLVTPDNAKAALRFLYARSGNKRTPSLERLATLLVTIARDHVGHDKDSLHRLRTLARNLRPEARGFTEKNRAFLRQFADRRTLPKLLDLPSNLVGRAENKATVGRRGAELVAYAVAIALELVLPLRMEDLAGLRWDKHILAQGDTVLVSVTAHKNGCAVDAEAPPDLSQLLHLYRHKYWPALASPGSPWLFPGANGGRRQTGGFGSQLSRIIYREAAITMTPHQARHLAAWIYLQAHTGDYETVRRLLGHKNVATTIRFYQELDKLMASRRYNEIVTKLVTQRVDQ